MTESRRSLLKTFVAIVGVFVAPPAPSSLLAQTATAPRARVYPNGRDPNAPPDLDEPSHLDPKALQQANRLELKKQVATLSEMVSELKEQVDKMDSNATLSVSVVKKAQQIQKLARQIQGLAKS
jgi:hypothetical protein